MEIGSIFEMKPLEIDKKDFPISISLDQVEKYQKPFTYYTASGREGIHLAILALQNMKKNMQKTVLLPAYMCDTVFFPFEREGWKLEFYRVNEQLEPDAAYLEKQIEAVRPGVLFVHPFYGIDTLKEIRPKFRNWRENGMIIMEDVTQSYYLEADWDNVDIVVGSLRKWYPIPDGGFVTANIPLPEEKMMPENPWAKKRHILLTEKWEYLYGKYQGNQEKKSCYLAENRVLEDELDQKDNIHALSQTAKWVLHQLSEVQAKQQRERNTAVLWKGIETGKPSEEWRPVLAKASKAAGLYFPIYVSNRENLQKKLQQAHIYAPVLWPIGKENQKDLGPVEKEIFQTLLAIPMDQRYKEADMERILQVLQ